MVFNPVNKHQIIHATNPLPATEDKFKKVMVSTDTHAATHKQHIIIGCSILSEKTFKDIKFDPKQPQFLEWLAKEKMFVELDLLGVSKTTTIG